jgi:hypothetical protein
LSIHLFIYSLIHSFIHQIVTSINSMPEMVLAPLILASSNSESKSWPCIAPLTKFSPCFLIHISKGWKSEWLNWSQALCWLLDTPSVWSCGWRRRMEFCGQYISSQP